jgi:Tol biopolymer transport system component
MRNRTRHGALLPVAAALAAVLTLATTVAAQTPYIPYYGKNQVRYDNFEWWTYETDHFTIYYYPEIEPHLERMAGYAESAYQHVSSELKYDLAHKVPLILFQTSSEFQQQNVIPGAAQEGVGAFAEPMRQRIVMPMDEPPDLLYRLIIHELTHQFEFDMIPTSLVRRNVPLWVNEGLSDYMTGIWRPMDLMSVRDAAVADIIPKMSKLEGYSEVGGGRMIYNLGHAVFEFMESRWGKEGIRGYLFALRKAVIGGGEEAYEEAFKISAEEFDQQFDKYLKDRFKPFRDKERPADYGRNLAPDPEETKFQGAYSVEPSPSGDLIAVATANRSDREMDIVLLSAKDGKEVQNLTKGFDQDYGFEFVVTPGGRWTTVPWFSYSPDGNHLAFFVRAEKSRSLILQNVLNRNITKRVDMRTVDDPESPDISPDGRRVAFAALQGGTGDIFVIDLVTDEVVNVTKDKFADSAPTWSPDGSYLLYLARISGNEKLFKLDLKTGQKTQITFGTHDDGTAKFVDNDTIVFASTATDPSQPIDPEVARNGNIYNIWTLSLKTGELRQFTDAVGGNLYAVVMRDGLNNTRIGFVSYYKAEYELHTLDRRDPIVTAASSDFGEAGADIIDFQAPLTHTLIAEKKRKKGTFEKLFMDGRPPVNVGVTSGGDIFGGSAVTFSDVLGDQQFTLYAQSISQYRTLSFSYLNLAQRFNYALQGFSQTQFFYGDLESVFFDPVYSQFIDRDYALATRTVRGGTAFGIWPFNRYRRVELFGGFMQYRENFNDPGLDAISQQYQTEQFGRPLFRSGNYLPLGVNFVQETTVFREFGPLAGNTVRIGYEFAPGIGDSTLSRQTADADARYYLRLGSTGLLAMRVRAFRSWGDSPDFMYFGGNSEMRGYEYLEFLGDRAGFVNAELRFPFIEAMLTPIGILGGIRGVLFANMGGGSFGTTSDPARQGEAFKWITNKSEVYTPVVGFQALNQVQQVPIFGQPTVVDGLRLVDARASYGVGLETFALGFPVHFDWSWKTLLNKDWEDLRFAAFGGSSAFRKPQFSVWIGYDF